MLKGSTLQMLTLQSSKSQIVYLRIMKVKLDNYGYNVQSDSRAQRVRTPLHTLQAMERYRKEVIQVRT